MTKTPYRFPVYTTILFVSLGLAVAGIAINYQKGFQRHLFLVAGAPEDMTQWSADQDSTIHPHVRKITTLQLDSLSIAAHRPNYMLQIWEADSANTGLHRRLPSGWHFIDEFPLEEMKIRAVPGTDFRFRLSAFYPDFYFSYSYPENTDTIPPRSPGITLDLHTDSGEQIVTLRSDQPARNKLGDVLNLGVVFEFYWEIPPDTLLRIGRGLNVHQHRILFSGKERLLYDLSGDTLQSRELGKDVFYGIPGKQDAGFTIVELFPDIAYLKATPASRGDSVLNPVAKVDVWKVGERYREVFLYPDQNGLRAGDYALPGLPLRIALGLSERDALHHCRCTLGLSNSNGDKLRSMPLMDGNTGRVNGYLLRLTGCRGFPVKEARITVTRKPGRTLMILAILLALIATGLQLWDKTGGSLKV